MIYNLSVFDRLMIVNILPSESDITTLKIIRDLKSQLGFTESEHEKLCFNVDKQTGSVRWKTEHESDICVEIGSMGSMIISEQLKILNEKKKLTVEHISLYEKFVK
jgi:DNA-binding transcriptional MerR regulator